MLLNSMAVFFSPHIDGDAGEFGQIGSGASNVVGLTLLSHCFLRSKQLSHVEVYIFNDLFLIASGWFSTFDIYTMQI
jgi:hypothetical protein